MLAASFDGFNESRPSALRDSSGLPPATDSVNLLPESRGHGLDLFTLGTEYGEDRAYVVKGLHHPLIPWIIYPVKGRISLPVTGQLIRLTIPAMAKPGRRPSTPFGYRMAFARRVKAARERSNLSQSEMAAELSRLSGRPILQDSYRKWESDHEDANALLPHDLIVPFCDITRLHPFELLGTASIADSGQTGSRNRARPFTEEPRDTNSKKRQAP